MAESSIVRTLSLDSNECKYSTAILMQRHAASSAIPAKRIATRWPSSMDLQMLRHGMTTRDTSSFHHSAMAEQAQRI